MKYISVQGDQGVKTTCSFTWKILNEKHFPKETQGNWLEIASSFEKYAHFPHCLGAVNENTKE